MQGIEACKREFGYTGAAQYLLNYVEAMHCPYALPAVLRRSLIDNTKLPPENGYSSYS